MNNFEKRVIELLKSDPFQVYKPKTLARKLDIPTHQYPAFRDTLKRMARQGKIIKFKKNQFGFSSKHSEVTGILSVNSNGYGFVDQPNGESIFISQKNMNFAMHEDTVRVQLFAKTKGKNREGQVVGIEKRARTHVVGTFCEGKKNAYVIADDIKLTKDIIIHYNDTGDAEHGQKVVVEIEDWEHTYLNPNGRVVDVLGDPNSAGVDMLSIIHSHNLPMNFPHKILEAARVIPNEIPQEEIKRRLDFRDKIAFTIDPETAKDFDDAVSLETDENGNFVVGVHIADVSHYIPWKSAIDNEAAERGTSVYLVDRVIPMLPEKLSNQICSLVEGEDRLCYSVFVTLSPDCQVLNYAIKETVINSKKRFTYQQAQDIIDGVEHDFSDILKSMYKLSKKLIEIRNSRGSVDLDSPEVDIELDENGKPIRIKKHESLDSNRLIEEFMLLANQTVARHVNVVLRKQVGQDLPFVYRVHEKPDMLNVNDLLNMAKTFGIKTNPIKRTTPKAFQQLSNNFKTHRASNILQYSLLRAMMKAEYTTENIGHFGLAYKHYTHFTSPIRRYPDLLVHRLLKHYALTTNFPPETDVLEKLCKQSTEREIRAMKAERDSIKIKKIQYLEQFVGDEFDGIISRITSFGFFVELDKTYIDGLVHVSSLEDDYYEYDEKKYCLRGQYSNNIYRLGDKVKVQIARIDRDEKLIDFKLV